MALYDVLTPAQKQTFDQAKAAGYGGSDDELAHQIMQGQRIIYGGYQNPTEIQPETGESVTLSRDENEVLSNPFAQREADRQEAEAEAQRQADADAAAARYAADAEIEAARIRAEADLEIYRLEQQRIAQEAADREDQRRRSAFDTVSGILGRYGLSSLASWAEGLIRSGASAARVELELYDQDAFKERFPAIFERQERGYAPISPGEYIEYEQTASQLMRQAGFPPGFYDQASDFTELIAADVSVAELSGRITQAFRDVAEGDEYVRDAYNQFFGINGVAALAAYHLDPDVAFPILERQAEMARVAGAAWSIDINIDEARTARLADRRISEAEAFQGFRQLNELRSLFDETLGEATDLDIAEEGVEATFGLSADASRIIENRRRARVNALRGGGGAQITGTGVIGLGTAS